MTPQETLDAFRKYLDMQPTPPIVVRGFLHGYLAGFEYELLKSQQEEDPQQMSLFD